MVLIARKYTALLVLTLTFWIGFSSGCLGQDLEKLRLERQKQQDEIAYTEELLKKAASDKSNQLSQMRLLANQIGSREKLVSSIRRELEYLDRSIKNREKEVRQLESELKILKQDYARMIYKAYQTRKSYDVAQYILAASDFNQAYKRVKYLQQYGRFRKQQAQEIREKSQLLGDQVKELAKSREDQRQLLNQRQKEVAQLNNEKKEKDQYLSRLSRQEKLLKQQLEEKKNARNRIEAEMQRILAEARAGATAGSGGLNLTPEMKLISNEFGQNKGRLPWPVERGVITSKYGKHKHEIMKNVEIDNKGVDITTGPGEPVRTVFEGQVSNVMSIKGANLTIIIQHGEFFTVYQNLVNVKVKKGDLVQRKQLIGTVYNDKGNNSSEFHFQLWKGSSNENPELWLAR